MPRKARIEKRLVADQDSVGEQRAVRKEQEELTSRKKVEAAALTKAQRLARLQDHEIESKGPAPRIARPGKPLKRP